MNTKALLLAAAALLGLDAVACLFAPVEILNALGLSQPAEAAVLVQLLGAALLGFAMLNWASHGQTIGGIYGRPLVFANLAFFGIAAISLIKAASASLNHRPLLGITAVVCALFAVAFWVVSSRPAMARG